MRHHLNTLIKARKQLMKAFGCPDEYLIKPLPDSPWRISGDDDMRILSYEHNSNMENAVIVRQNGEAMIFRTKGYVCVVAIDCVKIAFLFDENQELS
jgi:hypothetical protein